MPHVVIEYIPRGLKGLRILAGRLAEEFDVVDIQCCPDPLLAIPALILCKLAWPAAASCSTPRTASSWMLSWRRGGRARRCTARFTDLLGLYRNVIHLAGSPGEKRDIDRNHLRRQNVAVVSQFVEPLPAASPRNEKPRNRLRIAFVGRVTGQKNLTAAIEMLRQLHVPATLDVFGDTIDTDYYERCVGMIKAGTGPCEIRFKGNVNKESLLQALPHYDVLLHPTLGENFGHSIVEALHLGLPVLISDHPVDRCRGKPCRMGAAIVERLGLRGQARGYLCHGREWSELSAGAIQVRPQDIRPLPDRAEISGRLWLNSVFIASPRLNLGGGHHAMVDPEEGPLLRTAPAAVAADARRIAPAIEHAGALGRFAFRTVVDIGANRGQFATFARAMFPQSQIYSFEPLDAPATLFQRYLEEDDGVHLFNSAVGEHPGDKTIFVASSDDSSSLLRPTDAQNEIFGITVARTEQVSVRRLSECLAGRKMQRPALLKIDVRVANSTCCVVRRTC